MSDTRAPDPNRENTTQRFNRELLEILNELRVALPGVQLLFAFMLVAPFSDRFTQLSAAGRNVFFLAFVTVTAASVFLIAPSIYHRLHWRREIEDKEQMLRTFTQLAIIGTALMAVSMTCVVYVITAFLYPGRTATWVTVGTGLTFATLWFALPMSRRVGAPKKKPIADTHVDPPSYGTE